MRVPNVLVDPNDPQSVVEHLKAIRRAVDGGIEFGNPHDPRTQFALSGALADGTAHNGTLVNITGSWVVKQIGAAPDVLDASIDHVHNLDVPVAQVFGLNQPNVRWLVFGFQHAGAGAGTTSTISCNYELLDRGSITNNSFPLRYYANNRTVNAGNLLTATIFFTPAIL